jgi:hypothetical protein
MILAKRKESPENGLDLAAERTLAFSLSLSLSLYLSCARARAPVHSTVALERRSPVAGDVKTLIHVRRSRARRLTRGIARRGSP